MGLFDSIGNLFGGSPNGSGFQATGLTPQQLNAAYATTGDAYNQQQNLANALAPQGQQGIQSQNALTQALTQQMQGAGPNPAQAALNQNTGQNVANQAALMAGQRGASNNVGLMARQAAQQGANTQQQSVGQGATLQAQQQLAAQNQLQNLANTQIGQQAGAVGNLNNYALGNQQQLVGLQENMNNANAGMAQTNANNTAKALGGLLGGVGALGSSIGGMFGGGSPALAGGGAAGGAAPMMYAYDGGQVPEHLNNMNVVYHNKHYEHKESPKLAQVPSKDRFKKGGMVPGEPKVNHNDPKNDVVDAKLTPKEIVLPLSVTESENPPEEAAKFVAAILAKNGSKVDHKKEEGKFKSALKEAIKSRKK